MMTTRVSDSELAANLRRRNRLNSERRRQRLAAGGKVQLLTWIPDTLRRELDSVAAHRNMTVSETVSDLLERALAAAMLLNATTPAPAAATLDMFPAPASHESSATKDVLMMEVGKLLDEGLSGADIARRLTAEGFQTANGKPLNGANLLRDYRAWAKKAGTADTTPANTQNLKSYPQAE